MGGRLGAAVCRIDRFHPHCEVVGRINAMGVQRDADGSAPGPSRVTTSSRRRRPRSRDVLVQLDDNRFACGRMNKDPGPHGVVKFFEEFAFPRRRYVRKVGRAFRRRHGDGVGFSSICHFCSFVLSAPEQGESSERSMTY
jgi:hypothetical protein